MPGRAVRLRARRERAHRRSCRSGGRSARSTGWRCSTRPRRASCATARRTRSPSTRSCSTISSSCAAGDQVPPTASCSDADGLEIDESLLTGESEPVAKRRRRRGALGQHRRRGVGPFQATRVGRRLVRARGSRTEARRFTLVRSELDGRDQHDPALRHVGDRSRPRRCSRSASSRQHHGLARSDGGHRRRRRGDGARRARAADEPRVRGRGGDARAPPGARAGAARGRRCSRGSTSCASTRPARSPKARSCSTRSSRSTDDDSGRRRARRARRRRATATRRCSALVRGVSGADGWTRTGRRAVLVGAQVERGRRFEGHGTWVLGAPEMVWSDGPPPIRCAAGPTSSRREGRRVLLLARQRRSRSSGEALPGGLEPRRARDVRGAGPRPTRRRRFAYFAEQGVALQGHLGRQPAHRRRGGARASASIGADRPVDARELPEDPDALGRRCSSELGVRPRDAAPEAGDRRPRCKQRVTWSR